MEAKFKIRKAEAANLCDMIDIYNNGNSNTSTMSLIFKDVMKGLYQKLFRITREFSNDGRQFKCTITPLEMVILYIVMQNNPSSENSDIEYLMVSL